jgi:hypothetical protein
MKTIDDYILERLNPRHLGTTSEFPVRGTAEGVAGFLESRGFEELEADDSWDSWEQFVDTLDEARKPVFFWVPQMIRFADTSKYSISKNNPIYCIRYDDDNIGYYLESNKVSDEKETTEKEFLRSVNKQFKF